jgi:hypothetical protein
MWLIGLCRARTFVSLKNYKKRFIIHLLTFSIMSNYSKLVTTFIGIVLLLAHFNTQAQTTASINKDMNDTIKVPASDILVLTGYATGYQVYQCIQKDGNFIWDFKGPVATLVNKKKKIVATHYGGPSWESTDGSKVGFKSAKSIKPKAAGTVSWLLIETGSHEGKGIFSDVVRIQRVDTHGGDRPTTKPDASNEGQIIWIKYTAIYHFYKAWKPLVEWKS